MAETKQPNEMTALEVLEALAKWHTEHDLDCEEGVGSDRCAPCLAKAGVDLLKGSGTALYPGGDPFAAAQLHVPLGDRP